jgi:hypothetical protein
VGRYFYKHLLENLTNMRKIRIIVFGRIGTWADDGDAVRFGGVAVHAHVLDDVARLQHGLHLAEAHVLAKLELHLGSNL